MGRDQRGAGDVGRYELVSALDADVEVRSRALVPWLALGELDTWLARNQVSDSAALREAVRSGSVLLVGPVHELLQPVLPGPGSGDGPTQLPTWLKRWFGGAPIATADPSPPKDKPEPPEPGPGPGPEPEPDKKKEILAVRWTEKKVYCGDTANYTGEHVGYSAGEVFDALIEPEGAAAITSRVNMGGGSFSGKWPIKDVLPPDKKALEQKIGLSAGGKKSPDPLLMQFVPSFPSYDYAKDRHAFTLALDAYASEISSTFKFVPGWGGQVVKLGAAVDDTKVGGIVADLVYKGYRWMSKDDKFKDVYWDGKAWQPLPKGFVIADGNHFSVGFYKDGADFKCQYGGTWPEKFADWNIDDKANQDKLAAWEKNITDVWTNKFHIKRKDCLSKDKACCRYETKFKTKFAKQAAFKNGMLIVAIGNIRSNDQLFFLGEPRLTMAAHEFGHHIGNPDEYAGAALETTLNDDGAVKGIDADSIMGQNLTKVKKRHYRLILTVFADRVKAQYGKDLKYEVVPP